MKFGEAVKLSSQVAVSGWDWDHGKLVQLE